MQNYTHNIAQNCAKLFAQCCSLRHCTLWHLHAKLHSQHCTIAIFPRKINRQLCSLRHWAHKITLTTLHFATFACKMMHTTFCNCNIRTQNYSHDKLPKIAKFVQNCTNCAKLHKLRKFAQIKQNCTNCANLHKLSKIAQTMQNCTNHAKLHIMCEWHSHAKLLTRHCSLRHCTHKIKLPHSHANLHTQHCPIETLAQKYMGTTLLVVTMWAHTTKCTTLHFATFACKITHPTCMITTFKRKITHRTLRIATMRTQNYSHDVVCCDIVHAKLSAQHCHLSY